MYWAIQHDSMQNVLAIKAHISYFCDKATRHYLQCYPGTYHISTHTNNVLKKIIFWASFQFKSGPHNIPCIHPENTSPPPIQTMNYGLSISHGWNYQYRYHCLYTWENVRYVSYLFLDVLWHDSQNNVSIEGCMLIHHFFHKKLV